MLIFALMIGIISDYIADKGELSLILYFVLGSITLLKTSLRNNLLSISTEVDDLKKGKSRIIDIGHTVMLGWNDKSLAVIHQVELTT